MSQGKQLIYIQQTTIFLLYVKLVYSDKEESREKKGNENEKKKKIALQRIFYGILILL